MQRATPCKLKARRLLTNGSVLFTAELLNLQLSLQASLPAMEAFLLTWGVAKGCSVSWVAKFKGDKNSECKLSNGWSRSYTVINMLLSARK